MREEKIDKRRVSKPIPEKLNLERIVVEYKDREPYPKAKAKEDAATYYWTGTPCIKGHYSGRRVDTGQCRACNIYANRALHERQKAERLQRREDKASRKSAYILSFKERQQFLEAYSETGSIELAAKKCELTVPAVQVQIAKFPEFYNQVISLERRLKDQGKFIGMEELPTTKQQGFEWDDDKREMIIRVYVDTGDIAAARDAVGCTASMYAEELERNEDFKEKVKEAEPKATQLLEERAIQMALKGNDKLLQVILKAKKPNEYGDKIKIEQSTKIILSDDQINARIETLMRKGLIIDGSVESAEPVEERTRRITSESGRTGSTPDVQ